MSHSCDRTSVVNYFENNNNNIEDFKEFPYEILDVEENANQKLLQDFTGERTGFIQVGPKKWFFPSGYRKEAKHFYNLRPRPDDIWVVTFPRSGTTWTQEMIWLLENEMDFETALSVPLECRFPFLEFSSFVHPEVKNELLKENCHSDGKYEMVEKIAAPVWKYLTETSERRFIKTHLPFELLPPDLLQVGCKVVYVARNPKDVIVSFYHLNRLFRTQGYSGNFEKYWNYFKQNQQPWTPYFSHIQGGWERRNEENLLFMFYEDMSKVISGPESWLWNAQTHVVDELNVPKKIVGCPRPLYYACSALLTELRKRSIYWRSYTFVKPATRIQDLKNAIHKVSKFLGKSYSADDIDKLAEHLKIENFRNNKMVNAGICRELGIISDNPEGYVRKGKTGEWKNYFCGDLKTEVDEWICENLKNTDLRFPQT